MNKKTLTALNGSIKHWRRMRDNKARSGEMPDSWNCPLCDLYLTNSRLCEGCPIQKHTGKQLCKGTPYKRAWSVWKDWGFGSWPFIQEAEDMINFLVALRPKKKKSSGTSRA